jgi:hypothetical protein
VVAPDILAFGSPNHPSSQFWQLKENQRIQGRNRISGVEEIFLLRLLPASLDFVLSNQALLFPLTKIP